MTALLFPSRLTACVQIDVEFLHRQVFALAEVQHNRRTWNELGAKIAHEFQNRPLKKRYSSREAAVAFVLAEDQHDRSAWNERGVRIASNTPTHPVQSRHAMEAANAESPPSLWALAKQRVHDIMSSGDPKYHPVRLRLGNLRHPSTPILLSTLSLWLAGEFGMSITATLPMVAAMLHGVAEAAGDWNVLLER